MCAAMPSKGGARQSKEKARQTVRYQKNAAAVAKRKAAAERCILPRLYEWRMDAQVPKGGEDPSAGFEIPLYKLWHSLPMLTRSISRRDVMAKVEMFRACGGWQPNCVMLVRKMTKKEHDELLAEMEDPNDVDDASTTFRREFSQLVFRATMGRRASWATDTYYAVFDGGHRLAALLILAIEARLITSFFWEMPVPCGGYKENTPLPLTRGVSAICNSSHACGRESSTIDSLSYICTVLVEVRSTGKRLDCAQHLINELKAVGLVINDTGDTEELEKPFFTSKSFIVGLYNIVAFIGTQGVLALERLQDLDQGQASEGS
jgi:hypothetical protein